MTLYANFNHVFEYLDEPPLPDAELESIIDAIQPEWIELPGGRVFNAAKVNEIESTELCRRQLAGTGAGRPRPWSTSTSSPNGRSVTASASTRHGFG